MNKETKINKKIAENQGFLTKNILKTGKVRVRYGY